MSNTSKYRGTVNKRRYLLTNGYIRKEIIKLIPVQVIKMIALFSRRYDQFITNDECKINEDGTQITKINHLQNNYCTLFHGAEIIEMNSNQIYKWKIKILSNKISKFIIGLQIIDESNIFKTGYFWCTTFGLKSRDCFNWIGYSAPIVTLKNDIVTVIFKCKTRSLSFNYYRKQEYQFGIAFTGIPNYALSLASSLYSCGDSIKIIEFEISDIKNNNR